MPTRNRTSTNICWSNSSGTWRLITEKRMPNTRQVTPIPALDITFPKAATGAPGMEIGLNFHSATVLPKPPLLDVYSTTSVPVEIGSRIMKRAVQLRFVEFSAILEYLSFLTSQGLVYDDANAHYNREMGLDRCEPPCFMI